MLELGQCYDGPDGQQLTITGQAEGTLGEIFTGTMSFGAISMPLWVTLEGVLDAGYTLREPEPQPEPEPEPAWVDPVDPTV